MSLLAIGQKKYDCLLMISRRDMDVPGAAERAVSRVPRTEEGTPPTSAPDDLATDMILSTLSCASQRTALTRAQAIGM
jgi:hypothetical protein